MIAKGTALAQQSPSTKNSNKNNVITENSFVNDIIAIAQPCSSYNWVNIYNSTTMSKDTSTTTKNDHNSHHHNSTTNPISTNHNNNPKQLHFYCPGEQQCRKHSSGTVYGGGPPHSPACYTADSSICSAARHAGIIDGDGGVFCVEFAAGLPQYSSSVRNGIRTIAWADFPKSIVLYPSCALLPSTKKEMVRSTLASEDCSIQERQQEGKVPLLTTYKAWEDFQKKIALATNASTSSALLNKNNFDRFLCSTYTKDSCSGRFYCPGSSSCPKKNSYGSSLVWGIGPNGEQVATGDSAPCVFARYMNVIDDVQGGWYELTPATGFQSFIGDSNPRNGATVRPWRQPYQNCFTVAKPIMYFNNSSEEEEKSSSSKKENKNTTTNGTTSSVAEPAVMKNQADKLQSERGGEEYF